MNRKILISLCGGLALFAASAVSAFAGDACAVHSLLSFDPMLFLVPIGAFLVTTVVSALLRLRSFAALQIALAAMLTAHDRAFRDRLERRVDRTRFLRLIVA